MKSSQLIRIYCLAVCLIVGLIAICSVNAQSAACDLLPGTSAATADYPMNSLDREPPMSEPVVRSARASSCLSALSGSERRNAVIHVNLPADAPYVATLMADNVASFWEDGRFDDAIRALDELAELVGGDDLAICCDWKTPVPTGEAKDFGTDIRISDLDYVRDVDLDVHRESMTIMALVVGANEANATWISINSSTDGGLHWHQESWIGWSTLQIDDVDAAITGNKCFIGYAAGNRFFLNQFDISSGSLIPFTGGSYFHAAFALPVADTLIETEFVSNQDFSEKIARRVYVMGITQNHGLKLFWGDETGEDFHEYSTGVTNADRGLSICLNEDWTDYLLFASYYDTDDYLHIDGTTFAGWDNLAQGYVRSGSVRYTSIGAWKDTVYCAFEYRGGRICCLYAKSTDGGTSFHTGPIDDTTVTAEAPALSAREGGGVGVIYRYYELPREGRFCWSQYPDSLWEGPSDYTDHEPYYNQPSIEYIARGLYGIAYLTSTSPVVRGAYFDRGSMHCCFGNRGNYDGSLDDDVDLGDLSKLIDHLFISLDPLDCWEEGNVDGSLPEGPGSVTLGDLSVFIQHLFITEDPFPPCP